MKIALIGPAYPYRGGIAHHTNMLYLNLQERGHQVDVITFSRQYPKFLYPGAFQEEGGEGGFAGRVPSERLIDSMNPASWLATGRTLRERGYDLLVFRFWIPLFGLAFGVIARGAHRKGKQDVMVILDNLNPHDQQARRSLVSGLLSRGVSLSNGYLTRFFFRYCNLAVSQSSQVEREFAEMFPEIPQTMIPHPVYENFGAAIDKAEARRLLGITAPRVILFFGFVRKYKGLDRLLLAMPTIVARVPDVELLVVGEFFEDAEPYHQLIREGGVASHIRVHDAYVDNEEVARWFSAADMLVLPYRSATNSGIVQIGYNFAVPAIVTDVGSLSEVVLDGVTGYVVPEATPEALAAAVAKLYEGNRIAEFSRNIVIERRKYSWPAFVEKLEDFVRKVWGRGRR